MGLVRSFDRASTIATTAGATWRRITMLLLASTVAAFALRAPLFGNPVIHSDEQFYLLVGDRMLQGELPYIDIWDRKPIGLFLIYAGIRLLGGIGIIEYQVVATLFAAATAAIVMEAGRRLTSSGPGMDAAVAAGVTYLAWLLIFNGAGGQSPVFYNALVAGAGLIVLAESQRPASSLRELGRRANPALLLIGLAIQIKYTVAVEGLFFGIWLLGRAWRLGAPGYALLRAAIGWATIALLPTMLALLFYVRLGHGGLFIHSNFLSVFAREGEEVGRSAWRLGQIAVGLLPLLLCARLAAWPAKASSAFLWGWIASAMGGLLLLGTWYDHYALPVLVPLSIACAPAFASMRGSPLLRTGVPLLGIAAGTLLVSARAERRGDAADIARLIAAMGPLRGCMYAHGSEPILYHLTRSCLPTRFPFRSHLTKAEEARALGVDPLDEMHEVLARAPDVIVLRQAGITNRQTLAQLNRHLAREYWRGATVHVGDREHIVFRRLRAGPGHARPRLER